MTKPTLFEGKYENPPTDQQVLNYLHLVHIRDDRLMYKKEYKNFGNFIPSMYNFFEYILDKLCWVDYERREEPGHEDADYEREYLTPEGYLVYRALLAKYGEPEVPK